MKTMESLLLEEKYHLEKILQDTQKRLNTLPKGNVRIMKKNGGVEYYYKSDGRDDGSYKCDDRKENKYRYLKKNERYLAEGVAQRDYDVRVMKNAEERIRAIEKFLKVYEKTCLKRLYQNTNQNRRELVCVPIVSDDEFIKQWQAVKYVGRFFAEEATEIITERGERVRSKSEKIIADKLYSLGIPYRYEYPLVLDKNVKFYPDFTILRMPEREEVYLEHLGMLDDIDYVDGVIGKLNMYERNGIYIGVNLFVTYETSKKVLNTKALNKLIRKLFYVE